MCKILLSLFLSTFAWAQIGVPVSHAQPPQLLLDGIRGTTGDRLPLPQVMVGHETLMPASGGVFFDTNNLMIIHASLPPGAEVLYQINSGGRIQRIDILRPDEQARIDQAKK